MRSYWSRVGPQTIMIGDLIRKGEETQRQIHTVETPCKDRHTQWEDGHVTTEAGIAVLYLQAKEHQKLSATTRS